ncbi:hypothetical protein DL95DRAFT_108566 [Leptodontidium sp. 2 PMI_412]|nr:hypothetical protein DL95DRAFT_108566 [Leptodontidium sp. 2 PMI_412]
MLSSGGGGGMKQARLPCYWFLGTNRSALTPRANVRCRDEVIRSCQRQRICGGRVR